jgi:hypothetical protein
VVFVLKAGAGIEFAAFDEDTADGVEGRFAMSGTVHMQVFTDAAIQFPYQQVVRVSCWPIDRQFLATLVLWDTYQIINQMVLSGTSEGVCSFFSFCRVCQSEQEDEELRHP